MGGETNLRNLDPLRQPGGHHPPADRALQRAKAEDQPQPPPQVRAQDTAPEEPEKRQQITDADHAPEQPVAPFPPEDGLELRQIHAGVEFAILRYSLVGRDRLVILFLVVWRTLVVARFLMAN